ncbi:hypothetical protein DPMN_005021 [Dreissena polymorpha]|uniref:Uncharacterized protein n=1 Tax=Dreissena polymorpha TaxID=45954 RepID=A0A9D4MTR5_DREPO|nr:hypothetical protein DPMN_005021 [Dreissena polymorpha]
MYIKLLFVLAGVFGVRIRKDQVELSQLTFRYDPTSHFLVAHNTVACFLALLLGHERDMVHTDRGIEQLEIQMMFEWIGKVPEVPVYHSDHSIPQAVSRMCARQQMYFLDRTGQHSEHTTTLITTPPTSSLRVPTRTLHPDASTDAFISHTPEHTDTTIANIASFVTSSTDFPTTVSSKGTDKTVFSKETDPTVSSNITDTTVSSNETDPTVFSNITDTTVPSIGTDMLTSAASVSSIIAASGQTASSSQHGSTTVFTWPPSMVFYGPISATSSHQTYPTTTHARPERSGLMTKPSTTKPFVMFERKDHILVTYAVAVSPSNECYVFRVSDIDHQLLSAATKQYIHTGLLSSKRDSPHMWNIVTGQIGSMTPEVRTFCSGPVYMMVKPFRF